jgi:excisionase family DNA binding protein
MGFLFNVEPDFLGDYITVKTAAEMSGYNQQYLRRLLRGNILKSKRLGQQWLIERYGFVEYLKHAERATDKRFRPHDKPVVTTDS